MLTYLPRFTSFALIDTYEIGNLINRLSIEFKKVSDNELSNIIFTLDNKKALILIVRKDRPNTLLNAFTEFCTKAKEIEKVSGLKYKFDLRLENRASVLLNRNKNYMLKEVYVDNSFLEDKNELEVKIILYAKSYIDF